MTSPYLGTQQSRTNGYVISIAYNVVQPCENEIFRFAIFSEYGSTSPFQLLQPNPSAHSTAEIVANGAVGRPPTDPEHCRRSKLFGFPARRRTLRPP